jgi:hypothetical protein
MRPQTHSGLVIEALETVWLRRSLAKSKERIFYSDRGSPVSSSILKK